MTRADFVVPIEGTHSIPCAAFMPDTPPKRALLYLHGGGWCLGNIDSAAELATTLCDKTKTLVWVPDYRLAPKHPYPCANKDCLGTLQALHAAHPDLPLLLGGDSSGGHLALCTAHAAATQGFRIKHLLLVYPVTTLTPDQNSPSWLGYTKKWPLSPRLMLHFRDEYLQQTEPFDLILEKLPPTTLITADQDILADQQNNLAQDLTALNIQVVQHHYPDAHHVFLARPQEHHFALQAFDDLAAAIQGS